MRNAIIQNNLDTGATGFSPFTTAISKGARVMAIGVTANICEAINIIVPVNSKAKSLKDLKGLVFANKKGTSTDFSTKALLEVGDKAKESTTLKVVKKMKSELFLSDRVKNYLNKMGDKQVEFGWIKSRPDFRKSPFLDDSILRKAAKDIGFN